MASPWTTITLLMLVKNVAATLDNSWSQATLPYASASATNSRQFIPTHIYNCPEICKCNIVKSKVVIDCSFRDLSELPSNLESSVFDLNLAQNHIFNLTYEPSLRTLSVLNVSQNSIVKIDKRWIASLENLKVLDLSNNYVDTNALSGTFSNLKLVYLNLSHNRLQKISSVMFQELNTLLTLDLSHNEIQDIALEAFQNQIALEILDLSSNKIIEAKHEWFRNLRNLKVLNLKKNYIKLLRNVVFSPLKRLEILDISQNSIASVGLLSFKGLVNLDLLNISSNKISLLQDGVFRSLESIKKIDLSQNPFKSTDRIFQHSTKLDALYMRKLSNFEALTSFSLVGLNELEFFDISGSQSLSYVNLHAFLDTKNLRNLDLSNLNLSNVKMGTFKNLRKVETIKLGGNPWKCDCYLYWILLWLGEHTNTHLLSPSETFCHTPSNLYGQVFLDALDHSIVCTEASVSHYTNKTKFKVGSTAFLKCQVEGSPMPSLTWITPQKLTFQWIAPRNNSERPDSVTIQPADYHPIFTPEKISDGGESKRFFLMSNGNLAIRNIERGDGGFYTCIASNPLSNNSVSIRLTLDYSFLVHIKIVSVLVGMATSFGFLLLTLISVLIRMILKHFGVKCPCRSGNSSPRTQQIKKILESMEHYKKQQLDRLRDNYNVQVQRIKDNCMQQMERLRESYSSQAERLRDIRDYGTLQIDRIRENYYLQVQRVRDYSTSQIIRLRENYLYQRNRIRKFSAHHLYKLRENYKLQQQHLNKILENLNLESCRNVCQRTDSVVLEPNLTLENVLVPKICLQSFGKETSDSNDNSSQISAYFTPDEAASEVSGHESDEPDCIGIHSQQPFCFPEDLNDVSLEIENLEENDISNIPESSLSNNSLQPDVVVFCKLKRDNSNETIV